MTNTSDKLRADFNRKKSDPDFEKKRLEGIRRFWAEKGTHGSKTRERLAKCASASWAKRRLKGMAKLELAEAERTRRREQLLKNKAATSFETRRINRVKAASATPLGHVKKSLTMNAVNDKRRGFKVPAAMWKEYRWLKNSKGLSAAEAGRILGLVDDGGRKLCR